MALDMYNSLGEIRRIRSVTQVELASRLGVNQPRVSHIENRDIKRMTVETLLRFVEELGGSVEIKAVFPDANLAVPIHLAADAGE